MHPSAGTRIAGAVRRYGPRTLAVLGYAGTVVFAGLLLFSVFAAFTWHKYHGDYAMYANALWNSAHGQLFRYFMDLNYLRVHLSFSLLLLAPLFRVCDHSFLLAAVQWVSLVLGALVLLAAARRYRLPHAFTAALLFFLVAYRFTQNVQVHAFHGVSLYFLLLPLFYYGLSFHKRAVLLPWLILLGMREDAALIAIPLLLYFAVRDRWRLGYVLAGLSALYVLVAVFAVYPALNGSSVFHNRQKEFAALAGGELALVEPLRDRAEGLLLVAIPLLALMSRRLPVALLFICVPLGQNLLSDWRNQYVLETHYAAAVMACLAVGLLETAVRLRQGGSRPGESEGRLALRALALIVLTLLVHVRYGVIWGSPRPDHRLLSIQPQGLATLRVARETPRDGVLLCVGDNEEFFAHRRDLRVHKKGRVGPEPFDLVFLTAEDRSYLQRGRLHDLLISGELGVRVYDGYNILLERGADPSRNRELAELL